MVRAMAVNSVDSMPTARRVYFVNALFAAAAIMVACARAWVEGADASSVSAATLGEGC